MKGKRGLYLLQQGDSGYEVEKLVKRLKDKGFFGGDVVDEYNADVVEAVKQFQISENLTVDGIAGPATLKKLELY